MHWRRKWQPTPVFLPGESQGRGSLVGCRLWGPQTFIGRNLTGDLEQIMENSVKGILSEMQSQDQTLVAVPSEGLPAYDVNIVLVPKSNAQQILAKAYVYLKLTPAHALRQIEVELTVQ